MGASSRQGDSRGWRVDHKHAHPGKRQMICISPSHMHISLSFIFFAVHWTRPNGLFKCLRICADRWPHSANISGYLFAQKSGNCRASCHQVKSARCHNKFIQSSLHESCHINHENSLVNIYFISHFLWLLSLHLANRAWMTVPLLALWTTRLVASWHKVSLTLYDWLSLSQLDVG